MKQPEAKFKEHLVEAYEELFPDGWTHYNLKQNKAGVPDLVFAIDDQTVWLEAKVVDEHGFTPYQKLALPKMSLAGMKVVVVCLKNPDDPKKDQSIAIGLYDKKLNEFTFTKFFPRTVIHQELFWQSLL